MARQTFAAMVQTTAALADAAALRVAPFEDVRGGALRRRGAPCVFAVLTEGLYLVSPQIPCSCCVYLQTSSDLKLMGTAGHEYVRHYAGALLAGHHAKDIKDTMPRSLTSACGRTRHSLRAKSLLRSACARRGRGDGRRCGTEGQKEDGQAQGECRGRVVWFCTIERRNVRAYGSTGDAVAAGSCGVDKQRWVQRALRKLSAGLMRGNAWSTPAAAGSCLGRGGQCSAAGPAA